MKPWKKQLVIWYRIWNIISFSSSRFLSASSFSRISAISLRISLFFLTIFLRLAFFHRRRLTPASEGLCPTGGSIPLCGIWTTTSVCGARGGKPAPISTKASGAG